MHERRAGLPAHRRGNHDDLTLQAADAGATIVATVTATNLDKAVSALSAHTVLIAPATAASATVSSAPVTLSSHGAPLLVAQVSSTVAANIASAAARPARHSARVLKLRRAAGVKGALRIWILSAGDAHGRTLTLRGQAASVRVSFSVWAD